MPAAAETLRYFRTNDVGTTNKAKGGNFDPVTAADRAAETAMRAVLADRRPDDGITGEEFGSVEGTTGLTWVLDPIDGTRAFIAGAPTWGVLVAVNDGARVVHAIVAQPFTGEVFEGGSGRACLIRDGMTRALLTSDCTDLSSAILMTTFPEVGSAEERKAFEQVRDRVRLTRYGLDCYAYCLLAMGQIDLVIEAGLNSYDIQGPMGVIENAGGLVTGWDGGSALEGGRILAAANPTLHARAMELLRDV